MKQVIRTNKATIEFVNAATVRKRFDDHRAMVRDWDSMRKLCEIFPPVQHNGWTYKSVIPIEFSEDTLTIVMERVSGVTGGKLLRSNPDLLTRSMGTWLALFHLRTENSDGQVLLYGDWNRNNVVIDEVQRAVTAIDPGPLFGVVANGERDFLLTAWSITIGALKLRRNPRPLLRSLGESYNSLRALNASKIREEADNASDLLFKKFNRSPVPIRYLARIGPHLLYRYVIPIILDYL